MSKEKQRAYAKICQIMRDRKILVSVKSTAKHAAIAGGCAVLGGMLLGRAGFVMGGVAGSIYGAMSANEKEIRPLPELLENLNEDERDKLLSYIKQEFASCDFSNLLQLISFISNNDRRIDRLFQVIEYFFQHKIE